MEVVKSKNKKRVQFAHAADTFKKPIDVKDLMENFNCAIVIGNKSMVNDDLEKQFEEENAG